MTIRWNAIRRLDRAPELVRCAWRISNWPNLTARFLGVSNRYPASLQLRGGPRVLLPNFEDVTTAWAIFCRDEYDVDGREQVIVDLGANIGLFAIRALTAAPAARVFCFEPYPESAGRLRANLATNFLGWRVVVDDRAVAAAEGTGVMAGEGWNVGRFLRPDDGSTLAEEATATSEVAVRTITLEQILNDVTAAVGDVTGPRVDLLKIDIEGGEHAALAATSDEALRMVRRIQLEYHPPNDKHELFSRLEAAGFSLVKDMAYRENFGIAHFAHLDSPQASPESR
jgi:FkbM family methyltransferase